MFDEEEFFFKRTSLVLKTWFKNMNQQFFSLIRKVRTVQHWSQPTSLQHFKGGVLCESFKILKNRTFLLYSDIFTKTMGHKFKLVPHTHQSLNVVQGAFSY
jgi:hypothetical protein